MGNRYARGPYASNTSLGPCTTKPTFAPDLRCAAIALAVRIRGTGTATRIASRRCGAAARTCSRNCSASLRDRKKADDFSSPIVRTRDVKPSARCHVEDHPGVIVLPELRKDRVYVNGPCHGAHFSGCQFAASAHSLNEKGRECSRPIRSSLRAQPAKSSDCSTPGGALTTCRRYSTQWMLGASFRSGNRPVNLHELNLMFRLLKFVMELRGQSVKARLPLFWRIRNVFIQIYRQGFRMAL